MAMKLPKDKAAQIKSIVYAKADEFGYSVRSRPENTQFFKSLVDDTSIGGVLREFMDKDEVRTYIKDTILNAYMKKRFINVVLENASSADTIQQVYGVSSELIQQCTGKDSRVSVSRSEDGRIFVVSGGTVGYWETALKKALSLIAKQPGLIVEEKTPSICLHLVATNNSLTDADKKHIKTALGVVGVQAVFCND